MAPIKSGSLRMESPTDRLLGVPHYEHRSETYAPQRQTTKSTSAISDRLLGRIESLLVRKFAQYAETTQMRSE